jgi:CHAD domain-containing protein
MVAQIEMLERMAAAEQSDATLTTAYDSDTGKSMATKPRQRKHRGGYREPTKETARLRAAAKAARYTLRSLAEAVGTNQPHLTRAVQGLQTMPLAMAREIEKKLRGAGQPGFPATRESWPGLESD